MTGWQWLGAVILGAFVLAFFVSMLTDEDGRFALVILAVLGVLGLATAMFVGAFP